MASAIVAAAQAAGCDAIHPGYGFLSEQPRVRPPCAAAGLRFVGPGPEALALFGDKAAARALARELGVPRRRARHGGDQPEEVRDFFAALGGGAIMIKAMAGGGGRGMRLVRARPDLDEAYARCASEAAAAFGDGERLRRAGDRPARHIEVQVARRRHGRGGRLGDRDCSLQRRRQKLIEIAPAPSAAVHARPAGRGRHGAGRIDRLPQPGHVRVPGRPGRRRFVFIEANARLQVEHTVTEEVTGVDLVASRRSPRAPRWPRPGRRWPGQRAPRGRGLRRAAAGQHRDHGSRRRSSPTGGTLTVFEPPSGPGVRVDTAATPATRPARVRFAAGQGDRPERGTLEDAARRAGGRWTSSGIEGVETNAPLLAALLRRPGAPARSPPALLDAHAAELSAAPSSRDRRRTPCAGGRATRSGERAWRRAPLPATVGSVVACAEGDLVRPGQSWRCSRR